MIIVEGPDGAGKTTLVGKLTSSFRLMKSHSAGPEGDVRGRVYDALGAAVRGHDPIKVHDRLFFSEVVYGPLLRGECRFSDVETDFVWRVLGALETPLIFCLPPYEVVRENVSLSVNDQLVGVSENLRTIYSSYEELAQVAAGNDLPVYRYDYTLNNRLHFEGVQSAVNQYLLRRYERAW